MNLNHVRYDTNEQVVNDILDVELAFINIAHPDFGYGSGSFNHILQFRQT
jgi:hypothetical protein